LCPRHAAGQQTGKRSPGRHALGCAFTPALGNEGTLSYDLKLRVTTVGKTLGSHIHSIQPQQGEEGKRSPAVSPPMGDIAPQPAASPLLHPPARAALPKPPQPQLSPFPGCRARLLLGFSILSAVCCSNTPPSLPETQTSIASSALLPSSLLLLFTMQPKRQNMH